MHRQPSECFVSIQPKGLITIPKKLRKSVGLEPKTLARLSINKGKLIVEHVRTYTDKEIDEFIALDEKEAGELRRKGIL